MKEREVDGQKVSTGEMKALGEEENTRRKLKIGEDRTLGKLNLPGIENYT